MKKIFTLFALGMIVLTANVASAQCIDTIERGTNTIAIQAGRNVLVQSIPAVAKDSLTTFVLESRQANAWHIRMTAWTQVVVFTNPLSCTGVVFANHTMFDDISLFDVVQLRLAMFTPSGRHMVRSVGYICLSQTNCPLTRLVAIDGEDDIDVDLSSAYTFGSTGQNVFIKNPFNLNLQIKVMDLSGRIVSEVVLTSSDYSFTNDGQLASGIYLVTITLPDGTVKTEKVFM